MNLEFRKRRFKIILVLFLLSFCLYGFFKKIFEKSNKVEDRIFCMILTHLNNLKEKVCKIVF